jgi:3-methyladenine DNA glycosylase AlkC
MSVTVKEFSFLFRWNVEGDLLGSRFTAWISVRNESTWICVYRLRQLVVRKHAAELLACYGILFQDMGYLGSAHPE